MINHDQVHVSTFCLTATAGENVYLIQTAKAKTNTDKETSTNIEQEPGIVEI